MMLMEQVTSDLMMKEVCMIIEVSLLQAEYLRDDEKYRLFTEPRVLTLHYLGFQRIKRH